MMQLRLFLLTLAFLAGTALGGGYQGCLERVLVFQAYEIDALNNPGDQSVGFKCDLFDDKAKICTGSWIPCRGAREISVAPYTSFSSTWGGFRTKGAGQCTVPVKIYYSPGHG